MLVLICNERFIFRFGVDRVLLVLSKWLKELGHTVVLMGNSFDRDACRQYASRIIEVPASGAYIDLNESTDSWLKQNWERLFAGTAAPDLVLVAGWPFLSSIPFLRTVASAVIFSDHGVVPLKGYQGNHLLVLNKLKELRRQYLGRASAIIAVSKFIAESQSRPDSEGKTEIYPILNGADHMEMSLWQEGAVSTATKRGAATRILSRLRREKRQIVLNLGRWEPGCYKNSEAAFDVLPKIMKFHPRSALLILAAQDTTIPHTLRNTIIPIGCPHDDELSEIMKQVDLGLSFSLWEGFNLPLAEMQWFERPALCFDIGAHPEVVAHPWFLCRDNDDMSAKACDVLRGSYLDQETLKNGSDRFKARSRWRPIADAYIAVFHRFVLPVAPSRPTGTTRPTRIIIDVTNASKDAANSGVIRVTRRLSRELQRHADVAFVVWDEQKKGYALPTAEEYRVLGSFNGPVLTDKQRVSHAHDKTTLDEALQTMDADDVWLLFTETVNEKHARVLRAYAKNRGMKAAAVFYDAIPILRPQLCKDEAVRGNHADYMKGLAECDVVIPISAFSAECLQRFWGEQEIEGGRVVPNLLPGEFGGAQRRVPVRRDPGCEIKILCVSTLEPRKNHLRLIKACLLMQKQHPQLEWSLTLVGNRYAGAFELADAVEEIAAKNPRITWLGIVDDDTLRRLYSEATFTVYPSIIEGFGLPILESVWHGKPVICSREGVMAELAADGGCLTTDVMDEQALAETIYRLATDMTLLHSLSGQAGHRDIKTWDEYVQQFLDILGRHGPQTQRRASAVGSIPDAVPAAADTAWEDILYPGCLRDNWQMNHSERLALTALLARHKPHCSIEIGTFQGGSLSLISQYSDMVFSIDIDPGVPDRFGHFANVSFLTGASDLVLPLLIKELDAAGIPIDFILIDGDHSADGIRRDINNVLSYVPKKPLFVMMHDGFNPECRRGMLEADWAAAPYVDWVDVDFVPGRIIEHGGGGDGEMWGGLGLACLLPKKRTSALKINASAERSFMKQKSIAEQVKASGSEKHHESK